MVVLGGNLLEGGSHEGGWCSRAGTFGRGGRVSVSSVYMGRDSVRGEGALCTVKGAWSVGIQD